MCGASMRRSSIPEVDVLPADRQAVERVPEPEQRLHALEARLVAVAVVLGLERDVARVAGREREARGRRASSGVGDRGIEAPGVRRGRRARRACRARWRSSRRRGSASRAASSASHWSARGALGRGAMVASGIFTIGQSSLQEGCASSAMSEAASSSRPAPGGRAERDDLVLVDAEHAREFLHARGTRRARQLVGLRRADDRRHARPRPAARSSAGPPRSARGARRGAAPRRAGRGSGGGTPRSGDATRPVASLEMRA